MRLREDLALRSFLDIINEMLVRIYKIDFAVNGSGNNYIPVLDSFDITSIKVVTEPYEIYYLLEDSESAKEYMEANKFTVFRREGKIGIDIMSLWELIIIKFNKRICYNTETNKLFVLRFYHKIYWSINYKLNNLIYRARLELRYIKRKIIKPKFIAVKIRLKILKRRIKTLFR